MSAVRRKGWRNLVIRRAVVVLAMILGVLAVPAVVRAGVNGFRRPRAYWGVRFPR
jgi:hypothetical protein